MGDVVHDADREVVLRGALAELVEDRLHHGGRELLRGEAVAPGDDDGVLRETALSLALRLREARHDVHVERVADGARLLRPVEDGDRLHALRKRREEGRDVERAVEADLDDPHLLAAGDHPLHGLVRRLGARAHQDDDPLGLRVPHVIEEAVGASGPLREAVHLLLDDPGAGRVPAVAGLAGLEERVGVLRRAAEDRTVGRKGPPLVRGDRLGIEKGAKILVRELLDLGDLVGGPEAVEEVEERDARLQGRHLPDGGEVVRLLNGVRAEHGEAGLPAGHDVRVVPEDREGVRGDGAGRHVHAVGGQLPRDLVHVGDHQEEALRRRERRGQRPGLERAVDGARGAPLRLHLDDFGDVPPDVLHPLGGPLVGPLAHVRGGGDRIDGDDLVRPVGDRGDGFIPVKGDRTAFCHKGPPVTGGSFDGALVPAMIRMNQ